MHKRRKIDTVNLIGSNKKRSNWYDGSPRGEFKGEEWKGSGCMNHRFSKDFFETFTFKNYCFLKSILIFWGCAGFHCDTQASIVVPCSSPVASGILTCFPGRDRTYVPCIGR